MSYNQTYGYSKFAVIVIKYYYFLFVPQISLYYINAHSNNQVKAITSKYGVSHDIRYFTKFKCVFKKRNGLENCKDLITFDLSLGYLNLI